MALLDFVQNQTRKEEANKAYFTYLAFHNPEALVDEIKDISHGSIQEGAAELGSKVKGKRR